MKRAFWITLSLSFQLSSLTAFAGKPVLDLGTLEVEGQVRRPMIGSLDAQRILLPELHRAIAAGARATDQMISEEPSPGHESKVGVPQ